MTASNEGYKIPSGLSPFQRGLYQHLIDWKRKHITHKPGIFSKKNTAGELIEYKYDAILPADFMANEQWPHLYPAIKDELRRHLANNDFRLHNHFYHMASSQAANINLFLPLLLNPNASAILAALKPDFATLATDALDHGYCIEYWGGNFNTNRTGYKGPLNDRSGTGTDSDIAIAYRNHAGELCLWLIEHKLTEAEFTSCGGYKSRERRKHPELYDCERSFNALLADKKACYYHSACGYTYWDITDKHRDLFVGHSEDGGCPFKGGLNQLWRNQLLALAIQDQGHFKHVSFSVVRHPRNIALVASLNAFKKLISDQAGFRPYTSDEFVQAAEQHADAELRDWAAWYRGLYNL